MKWLNAEIKLYIKNEGPFNSYVINCRLKLCPLTPALAVSNDLPPMAKLFLPINITAPPMDVTAPLMDVMTSPTDVMAPLMDVTAPPMDVMAPSTNAPNT